jgi:hypothetical protein
MSTCERPEEHGTQLPDRAIGGHGWELIKLAAL